MRLSLVLILMLVFKSVGYANYGDIPDPPEEPKPRLSKPRLSVETFQAALQGDQQVVSSLESDIERVRGKGICLHYTIQEVFKAGDAEKDKKQRYVFDHLIVTDWYTEAMGRIRIWYGKDKNAVKYDPLISVDGGVRSTIIQGIDQCDAGVIYTIYPHTKMAIVTIVGDPLHTAEGFGILMDFLLISTRVNRVEVFDDTRQALSTSLYTMSHDVIGEIWGWLTRRPFVRPKDKTTSALTQYGYTPIPSREHHYEYSNFDGRCSQYCQVLSTNLFMLSHEVIGEIWQFLTLRPFVRPAVVASGS